MTYEEAKALLKQKGQEHLLRFYNQLTAFEKERLLKQISEIDWEVLSHIEHRADLSGKGKVEPAEGLNVQEIEARKAEFYEAGAEAIREGKVGAVLLAGGQGTRLGSDSPKGCFDVGITRPLYIFEQLITNLQEVCAKVGAYVPLYIMTSEKNDRETRAFFEIHSGFGYPADKIHFFCQKMAPAADFDGKLLLEEKGALALSPNGNGGWYSSLERANLVDDMIASGVEWLNVFTVDNVLQRIADPVFVGATVLSGSNCGAKIVKKAAPEERVGVLCREDGMPNVIEYYEMSEKMRQARDKKGNLLYADGVILNYLFRVSKLEEIAKTEIPTHVVKKKVPYVDETGAFVKPDTENGYKFETLILDMVKLMGSCLSFEVVREREFAPIKNRTGVDSVDTARELLKLNGVEL